MRGLLSRIQSFWRTLSRRRAFEHEMDEEFRLHLELRTQDLARAGLSPAEAARRVRVEFGSIQGHKEAGRDARGLRLVDGLRTEVRHAPGSSGGARASRQRPSLRWRSASRRTRRASAW